MPLVFCGHIMPNTTSAKKALRTSERKRTHNLRRKREMNDVVKSIRTLAKSGRKEEAQQALSQAYKAIDKATKNGLIKKNTASRKKAQLARTIKTTA